MKALKNWFKHNRSPSEIPPLLALRKKDSYLKKTGWFESFVQSIPVDNSGSPLPWYTYPSIHFLKSRVQKEWNIFEFGSGNSTLWWSKQVANVISCEHDKDWFSLMKPMIPNNVKYHYFDFIPSGDYSKAILTTNQIFDIVIIDGRDRVNCAKNCLNSLAPDGVIVWDNSDRHSYEEGYNYLTSHHFKRLDFWGMGPINSYEWCTSIFYRKDNCLEL